MHVDIGLKGEKWDLRATDIKDNQIKQAFDWLGLQDARIDNEAYRRIRSFWDGSPFLRFRCIP
jgi:hypothetical protein